MTIRTLVELAEAIDSMADIEIQPDDPDCPEWEQFYDCVTIGSLVRKIKSGRVRIKHQLKKVDLSCLVGSGVLCEFTDTAGNRRAIDYLRCISGENTFRFGGKDGGLYAGCRPLFNYWHHHDGRECPIPEGFVVDIKDIFTGRVTTEAPSSSEMRWNSVSAYRITGYAEGWG